MAGNMIDEDTYRVIEFNSQDKTLSLERYPGIWHCRDHEVAVKVMYAGICETDVHIINDRFPCEKNPIVLGHEISGTVHKIGMLVKTVSVGDKVAVNPQTDCFRCCACNRIEPHFCYTGTDKNWLGITKDGGWAEYCIVHEEQLFRLPREVLHEQAVLSDSLSHVIHAWYKIAPVQRRKSILLLGGGVTGHLMASVLHVQGYTNVTIVENNQDRRANLSKLVPGFNVVDPVVMGMKWKNCGENWGMDIVIDCDGEADAVKDAVKLLLPGGTLLLMKFIPENDIISLSPSQIYLKELKIIGSLMNPYNFMETISWLETLGERYLNFEKMNIKVYCIKEYKEALQEYKDGKVIKAVFKMDTSGSLKHFQRRVAEEYASGARGDTVCDVKAESIEYEEENNIRMTVSSKDSEDEDNAKRNEEN